MCVVLFDVFFLSSYFVCCVTAWAIRETLLYYTPATISNLFYVFEMFLLYIFLFIFFVTETYFSMLDFSSSFAVCIFCCCCSYFLNALYMFVYHRGREQHEKLNCVFSIVFFYYYYFLVDSYNTDKYKLCNIIYIFVDINTVKQYNELSRRIAPQSLKTTNNQSINELITNWLFEILNNLFA